MSEYIIYVTFEDEAQAQSICADVLNEKLAACANIFPSHKSLYWWEGKVQSANECAAILKTTGENLDALKDGIVKRHSYDVPCVVAWSIEKGHAPFLEWLNSEVL